MNGTTTFTVVWIHSGHVSNLPEFFLQLSFFFQKSFGNVWDMFWEASQNDLHSRGVVNALRVKAEPEAKKGLHSKKTVWSVFRVASRYGKRPAGQGGARDDGGVKLEAGGLFIRVLRTEALG